MYFASSAAALSSYHCRPLLAIGISANTTIFSIASTCSFDLPGLSDPSGCRCRAQDGSSFDNSLH
jgi:hypothetical protein